MSKLPALTGKQVVQALNQAGFVLSRRRGSHGCLQHADGRTTTVAVHTGETIGPGPMSKILRDVELTKDEFVRLL